MRRERGRKGGKRKSCLRPGAQRKAKGTTEDIHPALKSCTGKRKKVAGKVPVTCSASPGGKLSNLIPPLLLKIIALHTANGFGCLPTYHDHHLERKDESQKTSDTSPGSCSLQRNHWHNLVKSSCQKHAAGLLKASAGAGGESYLQFNAC